MPSSQKENKRLSDKLDEVEFVNSKLDVRVATLERNPWKISQYERRNNVEITAGIPNRVDDNNLEQKVCEIFKSIDVDLNSNEIEACHRLPYSAKEDRSKPKRTIIKDVNRKKCESALILIHYVNIYYLKLCILLMDQKINTYTYYYYYYTYTYLLHIK